MTGGSSYGGMIIWFLTARPRWSIHSMDMSNGGAARGSTTRLLPWTLIGLPMETTFKLGANALQIPSRDVGTIALDQGREQHADGISKESERLDCTGEPHIGGPTHRS